MSDDSDGCEQLDTVTHTAGEGERLSEAVVVALRVASGHDDSAEVGVLDPLYDTIDLDALDELFRDTDGGSSGGAVTFTHCGYEVTATAEGEVVVTCV